jgi:hypothetical protein
MLFGETVAVYCENHTEHTDAVRTSQEAHYVSAIEPNLLMLLLGLRTSRALLLRNKFFLILVLISLRG